MPFVHALRMQAHCNITHAQEARIDLAEKSGVATPIYALLAAVLVFTLIEEARVTDYADRTTNDVIELPRQEDFSLPLGVA